MLLESIHHSYDYWTRFSEKVMFDGINKFIIINYGVTALDIRADVYSGWVWWSSVRDNSKYLPAMRYSGLDVIGTGIYTGDIYFLQNNWRLIIDLTKVKVVGTLYSDNYDTAYYNANLVPQYPATVAALVSSILVPQNIVTGDISQIQFPTVPSAGENATATWNDKKALTVAKFIGLK